MKPRSVRERMPLQVTSGRVATVSACSTRRPLPVWSHLAHCGAGLQDLSSVMRISGQLEQLLRHSQTKACKIAVASAAATAAAAATSACSERCRSGGRRCGSGGGREEVSCVWRPEGFVARWPLLMGSYAWSLSSEPPVLFPPSGTSSYTRIPLVSSQPSFDTHAPALTY